MLWSTSHRVQGNYETEIDFKLNPNYSKVDEVKLIKITKFCYVRSCVQRNLVKILISDQVNQNLSTHY